MEIPIDKPVYHDEIASYWMENDLLCIVTTDRTRTVENVTRSFELMHRVTKGQKVCALADISLSGNRTEQARNLTAKLTAGQFKALAMFSESSYGKLVGNTFLTLSRSPVPMALFASEAEARKWLKEVVQCKELFAERSDFYRGSCQAFNSRNSQNSAFRLRSRL